MQINNLFSLDILNPDQEMTEEIQNKLQEEVYEDLKTLPELKDVSSLEEASLIDLPNEKCVEYIRSLGIEASEQYEKSLYNIVSIANLIRFDVAQTILVEKVKQDVKKNIPDLDVDDIEAFYIRKNFQYGILIRKKNKITDKLETISLKYFYDHESDRFTYTLEHNFGRGLEVTLKQIEALLKDEIPESNEAKKAITYSNVKQNKVVIQLENGTKITVE